MYNKVKRLCDARGISIHKFEADIGLANGAVGKWKTVTPTLANVKKVADYFGISVDALIDGLDLSKEDK
jgi:transcriptional regulator with XRE-family HTH domain